MPKHSVDGIAEILARVDQGSVEIEDQQAKGIGGQGAQGVNHTASLKECGWMEAPSRIVSVTGPETNNV